MRIAMRNTCTRTVLHSLLGLILLATAAACGSEQSNGQTVKVNLALVFASGQAAQQSPAARVMAAIQRWLPGVAAAWAQSVTEITRIEVTISAPDMAVPVTTTVPVSDPTSGQEIPVSLQAPVGLNRTITVAAFNGANQRIFGGTLSGVALNSGAPNNLTINLVRLFTVTVQKQGAGSGTVSSTPAGINCGATCSAQFEDGTSVSLNAAAAPGSAFAGWSGACSGMRACTVSGNATVNARFIVPVSYQSFACG